MHLFAVYNMFYNILDVKVKTNTIVVIVICEGPDFKGHGKGHVAPPPSVHPDAWNE